MSSAAQHFRCVPFATNLTRDQCSKRHVRSKREMAREGTPGEMHLAGHQKCAICPIGAAHRAREEPTTWPDGAPIELVAAPVPAPGSTRWTSAPPPRAPRAPRTRPPAPTDTSRSADERVAEDLRDASGLEVCTSKREADAKEREAKRKKNSTKPAPSASAAKAKSPPKSTSPKAAGGPATDPRARGALELFDERINALEAELEQLYASANGFAASLGLAPPYID